MISLVKRVTASEQVYSELKRMIAQCELAPGTPLVAQTLAGRMGVSRTPVVEALRRLERDGLVLASPKWGASVREWTAHEIYEARRIRRVLEGETARLFVLHAKLEDKKKLPGLSDAYDEYTTRSDLPKALEVDLELHLHVARCTGFQRLYELVESSKITTIAIYGASDLLCDPGELEARRVRSLGCHKPLVEALVGDDPEKATKAMWQHIDTHADYIMKLTGSGSEGKDDPLLGALGR